MHKLFSAVVAITFLVSCYHTAPGPEFNRSLLIPADSMAIIITDLHLADGAINARKVHKDSLKTVSSAYLNEILTRHNVTKEQFDESMRFYTYDPREISKIYEKVIIELGKKESQVMPRKEEPKEEVNAEKKTVE